MTRGVVQQDAATVREVCCRALERAGVAPEDAEVVTAVLVRTSLRGYDTHGVEALPGYVQSIAVGGIEPRPGTRVVRDSQAIAVLDGDGGIGQLTATRATELAIARAKTTGIAAVLVRNSSHLGAAGHYALLCAEAGQVGFVYTTAPQVLRATGARGATTGSGPRAYGVPAAGAPIVLDLAMSVAAGAKVTGAARRDEPIPPGWLTDRDGNPSTEPKDFAAGGALLPIGEHKGFGLALIGDLVAGALAGAAMADAIGPLPLAPDRPWRCGHAVIALDVEAFMPLTTFTSRVGEYCAGIRGAPKEPGTERIYIPGERAHECERERSQAGIPMPTEVWDALSGLAAG